MQLSKTIVFITGAFVSHNIWDAWVAHYKTKGYTCLVPAWPYKDASPEDLRNRQPNDKELAALRFEQLLSHYTNLIAALPEKPIVIGHSLGGLIVQLLVNRDLVNAGIAIHSAPPKGVFSFEWSLVKSIWKPLGYLTSKHKTYLMNLSQWKEAITNGMQPQEQLATYEKFVVPESKRVLRDTLTSAARIDFLKLHPPLLFISGADDVMIPPSVNYQNYLSYDRKHSVTDYKEFKGKNHFSIAQPYWQDEADYILEWLGILQHEV